MTTSLDPQDLIIQRRWIAAFLFPPQSPLINSQDWESQSSPLFSKELTSWRTRLSEAYDILCTGTSAFRGWVHPFSGRTREIETRPQALADISRHLLNAAREALANDTWRHQPDPVEYLQLRLAEAGLPSDSAVSLYSFWQQARILVALSDSLPDAADGHPLDGVALLSFRIGGVQDFIDRARTTGDFWAGSRLISTLSEEVAQELISTCSLTPYSILFPRSGGKPEAIHTNMYPNGFLALGPQSKFGDFSAIKIVEKKWSAIVDSVSNELAKRLFGASAPAVWTDIWTRQRPASQVFEVFQTVTTVEEGPYAESYQRASAAMEARKIRRDFAQSLEKGTICHLCGQREAIHDGNGASEFWRGRMSNNTKLQNWRYRFRQTERLCAVCVTRRLYRSQTAGAEPGFPSTSSIASRGFLQQLLDRLPENLQLETELTRFEEEWNALRREIQIPLIPQLHRDLPGLQADRKVLQMDGVWLYESTYDSVNLRKELITSEEAKKKWWAAKESLGALMKAAAEAGIPKPDAYYALVSVDLDHVGEWINGTRLPRSSPMEGPAASLLSHWALGEALANLQREFLFALRPHLATSVYSGGDDLLVLVPKRCLAGALQALQEVLEKDWANAPEGSKEPLLLPGSHFTMSAAAFVIHHARSLNGAIRETQRLLREQAKERFGRNCAVVAVERRSGQQTLASARWRAHGEESFRHLLGLAGLIQAFGDDRRLSGRFANHLAAFSESLEPIRDHARLASFAHRLLERAASGELRGSEEYSLIRDHLRLLISDYASEGRAIWPRLVDWVLTARFLARSQQ